MKKVISISIFLIISLITVQYLHSENIIFNKRAYIGDLEKQKNILLNNADSEYVALNRMNNFTDRPARGLFTRNATSGQGTGQFVGKEFEFAKGDCKNLDKKWLKRYGWKSHTLGCSGKLLNSDWCARLLSDHSVKYTLHFLSWTIGPDGPKQRCRGDCESSNNQTAYIRTRSQDNGTNYSKKDVN